MSRTYRRSRDSWHRYGYVEAWYNFYEHEHTSVNETYHPESKRIARYLGDFRWGWKAPSDFRRGLNKTFRTKNKAILGRYIKEDKEYPFMPFKHNASYGYF